MTKTSVLIPDGESTLTGHVVHCLSGDRDIDIHILSKDPNASIKYSKFIKSFHTYDANVIGEVQPEKSMSHDKVMEELIRYHYYDASKSEALISEIAKYCKKTGAEIVFPVDEHIVKILSANREKVREFALLAPMPDYDSFITAIDKWRLSQRLSANNVPHPETVKYDSSAKDSVFDTVKFPVIIKPIDMGNAQGIHSFQKKEDLLAFFSGQKLKHQYIVQPFINGYDIDCSVLCSEGKVVAYTIQKAIVHAKVKYRAAVGITFLYEEKVIQVVEKMMKLLDWSGIAHIDLRYDRDSDQVKVIEINARYWGSLLGSLTAGVNFPVLAARIAKNGNAGQSKYSFSRYFMGKAPIPRLLKSMFASGDEKIKLRETSLYYTMRDPMPVVFETWNKIKRRLG